MTEEEYNEKIADLEDNITILRANNKELLEEIDDDKGIISDLKDNIDGYKEIISDYEDRFDSISHLADY